MDEFRLDFTGRAVLILETTSGPIEFKVNDKDVVTELLRVIVDTTSSMSVDAYDAETQTTLETMLKTVPENKE